MQEQTPPAPKAIDSFEGLMKVVRSACRFFVRELRENPNPPLGKLTGEKEGMGTWKMGVPNQELQSAYEETGEGWVRLNISILVTPEVFAQIPKPDQWGELSEDKTFKPGKEGQVFANGGLCNLGTQVFHGIKVPQGYTVRVGGYVKTDKETKKLAKKEPWMGQILVALNLEFQLISNEKRPGIGNIPVYKRSLNIHVVA